MELLPVYQSIIESTGQKLIREFDVDRDIKKNPAINIILSKIVYF